MNSPPRSLFVTNLAWISIAVSGTYVLLAGLQDLAAMLVPGSVLAAAVAWQVLLFSDIRHTVASVDDTLAATVATITIVVQVGVALVALATAGVFAWIARRLMQPDIRAEFHS